MEVKEWYKLFFSWTGIVYNGDIATFASARFSGPVLKRAQKINPDTYIDLDFSYQNANTSLFLPRTFYVARLEWKEVEYKDDTVLLKDCTLLHTKTGSLKSLQDGFQFLIDCSGHEAHRHHTMLVYPAWVLNPDESIIK
jgi:hypothetical protein